MFEGLLQMPGPLTSKTKVVRTGFEKACREFSGRVNSLGFQRTRKTFWTRRHPFSVDFIHFHRGGCSYGAPYSASVDIRVHFGIRVLNDDFVAAALNGPHSDTELTRAGRYHLRFNSETGSMYDRCADDLLRFVLEQGEVWFLKWRTVDALLQPDSPLRPGEKEFLLEHQRGQEVPERIAASLQILGIKD